MATEYPNGSPQQRRIWDVLIGKALKRQTTTFQEVARLAGMNPRFAPAVAAALDPIAAYCCSSDLPLLPALVLPQDGTTPSGLVPWLNRLGQTLAEAQEAVFDFEWCGSQPVTSEQAPPASEYTMGYSPEFLQLLDRRNAQTHAAYLLPRLSPGLRVLDFGCGPGTITVGLAAAVQPGEVHGVDMEESQIEMARSAADAGGHDNVTFHVGNVYDLPFEDNYFDVAHCHAVLMHVPNTQTALREVRRVLKPDGLLTCREMIADASFTEPAGGHMPEAWATFIRMLTANGGHPQMGRGVEGSPA